MQGDWAEVSRLSHRNYSDENSLGALRPFEGPQGKARPSTAFSPEPVEGSGRAG